MKQMLLITGVFDRFSGGNSKEEKTEPKYTIEDYIEILNEYKDAEAEILINIATIYFEDENIKESTKHLKKALEMYDELEDVGKQALVLDIMGDINRYNKKIPKALENYRDAYQLYSEINSDSKEEVKDKIKNLEVLKTAGINETRYNIQEPSIETPSPVPGDEMSSSDYNKISDNVKEVIGMLKGADSYSSYLKSEDPMKELKNAYEMSSEIGDTSGKATLLLIMGNVSLKESKTNAALNYFKKSLEYFQDIDDETGEAASRLLIGTAYYMNGDMDMVNSNFRKSIKLFRDSKDLLGEDIAIRLMNAIYED
ncbi:tetratricopeptide repeat protein [Methanobacterium sp. SMA-27]|uniref:tetratricopeptide repeat protein n=1 Tax=Methanobacterium sp. SMA-27 TaxID=1495336 RepID=UPI00064EA773|nr:tetratricopeptide repeat protein [Methanobacterium sp. SMA-27]